MAGSSLTAGASSWTGEIMMDGLGKPLREDELLSICSACPDHPVRKHGLTVRRVAKFKRSEALQQTFGEQSPAPMVAGSTSNSSTATATIANTRDRENTSGVISPKLKFASNPNLSDDKTKMTIRLRRPISLLRLASPYGPGGLAKNLQDRELRNMKRASSISVLSGLGVRNPERMLESSADSSFANSTIVK